MNLPELLLHFNEVRNSGGGKYKVSCPMPNHNDSDPSVSVCQDKDTGNILISCLGCGARAPEIMEALNLSLRDLFGDPGQPQAIPSTRIATEVTEKDIEDLSEYLIQTNDKLDLAADYIAGRFGLSLLGGDSLMLGVDPGDDSIERPEGYDYFSKGTPHLIIPFFDPTGRPVAMQGRRLIPGEPRWRSKSGAGWSKIGCFGWHLVEKGPVIITEGPSDALSVVGRCHLPAIAIRGASNTAPEVCEKIREWLDGRNALVIGDNGEAGQKFAREIAEGVGIPAWQLPEEYSDLADYLADDGELDEALLLAGNPEPTEPETPVTERRKALVQRILADVPVAIDDEELHQEVNSLPPEHKQTLLREVTEEYEDFARTNAFITLATARGRLSDLRRRLRAAEPPRDNGGGGGGHGAHAVGDPILGLPDIIWNVEDQLHITEQVIQDAMNQYERGEFYQAAQGQYVKVDSDDLIPLKEPGVKSMLSQMGHWRVVQGQRELGHVPTEAAKMVTDPSWKCDIPVIKRRVTVPFMLADGTIVSNPGYYEDSGVFLLPRHYDQIIVPEVPAIILPEHVELARQIFEDVVQGFMFKDDASKANLIAMTLTSPLRELFIDNPMVPLLTSTAPQSGSGKGTSVRVPLSTVGVGPHSLSTTTYNPDENEFEKKLVGKLLKKSTYIFLDNIRAQVNSSVLEQMLTAANYDGRTLGFSEVNSLSTLVLWACTLQSTGSFNRDLIRRCVPVELIKNYRGEWEHKNIEAYLADKRGDLIWACFVVARKWMQDGGPISHARLDGYGGWTEVIGGILENVLGYEGFLTNLESFRRQQDEVAMTIDAVLERWLDNYGEEERPARDAAEDLEDPALHQLLGLHNPSARQVVKALERQLISQRGHIIRNSHIWEPTGQSNYQHQGLKHLFHCVPLPREE